MRVTLIVLLFYLTTSLAQGQLQGPLAVGSPEAAFSGSPRLSRHAVAMLRAHYQGDTVPLIPQPFRTRLDTALAGFDWPRVEAVKKELVDKYGIVAALMWEQSRFIATGSIGLAELHARDVAATGSTGLSETAVMLWMYAYAVTMTDGHKCVDEAAKDAHLDYLRGPTFEPVLQIVRAIADDRLAAMRDLAIRLETVLADDRSDDTMCRIGAAKPDIKPAPVWRPEATQTRTMLPKHLLALTAVMRPRPIARRELPKPEAEPAPSHESARISSDAAASRPDPDIAKATETSASPNPEPTIPTATTETSPPPTAEPTKASATETSPPPTTEPIASPPPATANTSISAAPNADDAQPAVSDAAPPH